MSSCLYLVPGPYSAVSNDILTATLPELQRYVFSQTSLGSNVCLFSAKERFAGLLLSFKVLIFYIYLHFSLLRLCLGSPSIFVVLGSVNRLSGNEPFTSSYFLKKKYTVNCKLVWIIDLTPWDERSIIATSFPDLTVPDTSFHCDLFAEVRAVPGAEIQPHGHHGGRRGSFVEIEQTRRKLEVGHSWWLGLLFWRALLGLWPVDVIEFCSHFLEVISG
mgnify:CR=1 FL=1